MNEVYLLWESYISNKLIPIGVLKQINNKFVFNYLETVQNAISEGCFIPFPYTKEKMIFDTLPDFFEQRILKGEFYYQKFNLKDKNQLNCLVYNDSIKNTDNFKIVSKEKYDKIMN